jgi:hypothetical protein
MRTPRNVDTPQSFERPSQRGLENHGLPALAARLQKDEIAVVLEEVSLALAEASDVQRFTRRHAHALERRAVGESTSCPESSKVMNPRSNR